MEKETKIIHIESNQVKPIKPLKSKEQFYKIREQPLLIKSGMENEFAKKLTFHNFKLKIENRKVRVVKSLSGFDTQEEEEDKGIMICDLYDFIDYCQGEDLNITISNGLFNLEKLKWKREQEPLYLLNLNCNKAEDLKRIVSIPKYFGDWFEGFMPKYTDRVVYDKGHTWFFIGPENTLSELHADHDDIHTTIQQITGLKQFFIIKPEELAILKSNYAKKEISSIRFKFWFA